MGSKPKERKSSAGAIELRAALCHVSLGVTIMKPFLIALSILAVAAPPSRSQNRMQTAIRLGFSNIPLSLSRTIPQSKHGHRHRKALLLTDPERLERVAHGPQPDPSGGSTPT
jgi:hypothetical protein